MKNQYYIQMLCANISGLQKKANLTAAEMAQRLGISEEHVQMMADGILPEELTVEGLRRLEQEFGISLKEIFLPQ